MEGPLKYIKDNIDKLFTVRPLTESERMTKEAVQSRVKSFKRIGIREAPFRPCSGLRMPIDCLLDMDVEEAVDILDSL